MTMHTRVLILIVALTAFVVAPAEAQDAKAPAPQQRLAPEERLKVLTAALALTPTQQEKVRDVYEKNEMPRKKLRLDATLSVEDRRAQLRKLSQAEKEEVKTHLTPEQRQKWDELMAKNAANKAKGDPAVPGAPAGEK